MLFRSAWMLVCFMVSLKTQTFGPKAATFASGQIDEGACAWLAAAAPAGTAARAAPASAAPVTRAAANTAGRRNQRTGLTKLLMASPRGRRRTRTGWHYAWWLPLLAPPLWSVFIRVLFPVNHDG